MRILEDERDVVAAEIRTALQQLPEGSAREGYEALLAEVEAGEVSESLLPRLERLVEVGLESGRIRAVHTAHGEMAAVRLFQRTPRGAELRETVSAVNQALEGFRGAEVHQFSLSLRGPGAYTLSLETDRGRATILLDRQGARIQSVEVGG